MIQHYGMWDQIAVSGHSDTQIVEYIDFLQESVEDPVTTRDGQYETPKAPGWGLEFHEDFLAKHTYPTGDIWQHRPQEKRGVFYEVDNSL